MATETFSVTTTALTKAGYAVEFPYPYGGASGAYDGSTAVLKRNGMTLPRMYAVEIRQSGVAVKVGAGSEIPAGNLTLELRYTDPSPAIGIVVTQAAYDALTPDPSTLYLIVG
jgi:hypothetical protein